MLPQGGIFYALPRRGWLLFPLYDHIIIVIQGQVSQIVNKIIGSPFFCGIQVSNEFKIETLVH